MMSPGHDGVTAKQLTCPTLAHPAMGTDVYWIQGYECFKFVSIFSKAWKGRHLRPPCRSIPSPPASSPISIPIPLILYVFPRVSPHFPCPGKPAVLSFFPALISDLLSDPKVLTPCMCCRTRTTGITCVTLSPN